MRPTFLGFETARKSLMTSQKAMDITGNNIANVDTKGYTRQKVDVFSVVTPAADKTSASSVALSGQGVMAAGVEQIRDPYLDTKYRDLNSQTCEAQIRNDILGDIEENINTESMRSALSDFRTAISSYGTHSTAFDDIAATVRTKASQIVSTFNDYSARLDKITAQTEFEIDSEINNLNATLSKIADLNKQIKDAYIGSGNIDTSVAGNYKIDATYGPNELLDTRNVLLDSLSSYGEIDIQEQDDGTVTVEMSGVEVVNDNKATQLSYIKDSRTGAITMMFNNGSEYNPEDGKLNGYINIYNGNGCYAENTQTSDKGIPYFKTTIDQFANEFAQAFNDANIDPDDPLTLKPMFSSSDGLEINASNIRISDEWLANPAYVIPASQDGEQDNAHIMKLLSVFDVDISFGEKDEFTGKLQEYLSFYSNELNQEINFQNGRYKSTLTLTNNVLDSRDSVSGVNMDEEGVNMMSQQKWFNASARLMTTLDEELDTIINNMGLVGR